MMLFVLVASFFPLETSAKDLTKRISFGFEIGNWQPHSLNDEPRFDTFGAAGATPYLGISFTTPIASGISFRISAGYWSLRDLQETEKVHSLTLHPITIEIKHWLVPDYILSAYVIYGGGIYWGIENETDPLGTNLHDARGGWGAHIGAGFDLSITSHLGIGMTFQYNYVHFYEPIGGVDDFSGPKITTIIYFYL